MGSIIELKNSELINIKYNQKGVEELGGGVIFHINYKTGKIKFLLLKTKGRIKLWDVPKGHKERGETIEACALREVIEETGISADNLQLIKKLLHKNIYAKRNKFGRRKVKIVHLFLFQAQNKMIKLSHEHCKYKWIKYKKIEKKLSFPQITFEAFTESQKIINEMFFPPE